MSTGDFEIIHLFKLVNFPFNSTKEGKVIILLPHIFTHLNIWKQSFG